MDQKKSTFPYVTKVLKEKFDQEFKSLNEFEENLKSTDPAIVRQAEGNIPSCKHRMLELQNVMSILPTVTAV